MKVLVTGVSGTGKSSACKELKKKGYSTLDIDDEPDIRSWHNRETGEKAKYTAGAGQDWIEKHKYMWDEEKVKKFLEESSKPVFVCAVVSDQIDNIHLFDKTILLRINPSVLRDRLANRDTNPFGKEESEMKGVLNWQPKFDAEMIKAGAIPINSEGHVDKTVERILSDIH